MAQVKSATDLLSVEEYLAAENDGTWRHEFVNGMVYAMVGASERHNVIKLNVAGLLNSAISEVCRVFDGDMKLQVHDAGETRFYYPDIYVSCDEGDETGLGLALPGEERVAQLRRDAALRVGDE